MKPILSFDVFVKYAMLQKNICFMNELRGDRLATVC